MKNYLPLILGMMAVTYLPRLLPLLTLSKRPLPPAVRRFFLYVPYTALGALIVRGALSAGPELRLATLAGIGVAAACAWFRGGLALGVAAAIAAAFLIQSF
jgi:branched-subunit amino acid transport protein